MNIIKTSILLAGLNMKALVIFVGVALIYSPATASVLSVSSPEVNKGEWSLETGMSWKMDDDPEKDDFREYAFEIGYSPTNFWNTAFEFSAKQESGGDPQYAVTAWKNTLQFIKQDDQFPLSAGLRLQYEKAHLNGEADEIATRLLLRHQNESFDTRFNIGVEREIGSDSESDLAGDIRASVRYKWSDDFKPAIDYLGDTGSLHHFQGFEKQDHRIGLVFYGNFDDISYEAGYLIGLTQDSPNQTLKIVIGYNF